MNPTVQEIQNAIYLAALESIRDGRGAQGRPVWDLVQQREQAKQAIEMAKKAEAKHGEH